MIAFFCYLDDYVHNCFILERDIKLPLALQRCLMGFKDGMLLFQFVMRQATNVIRQKAFVYGLDGQSTGTILEVSFFMISNEINCAWPCSFLDFS